MSKHGGVLERWMFEHSSPGVYVKIGFTIGVYIIVVRVRARARGKFLRSNDERLFAEGSENDLTSSLSRMEDDVDIGSCGSELNRD